ncbi:hypothetical protein M405DRAFT_835655, partial [Rhizopogon salebrosus TDB-379]
CTVLGILELIATGSNPLSRFHNDLALSPTTVTFAKSRAERFSPPTPTSDLEDLQRQYKVQRRQLYRMATRTSLELST